VTAQTIFTIGYGQATQAAVVSTFREASDDATSRLPLDWSFG
jgi:hypothetical protein